MTSDNLIDGCLLMLQTKDYKNTNNLYHLDVYVTFTCQLARSVTT